MLASPGLFLYEVEKGAFELSLGKDAKPDVVAHEGGVAVEAAPVEPPR